MSWSTLCIISLVASSLVLSRAQSCSSNYEWANNARGESPCQIASTIKSLCSSIVRENSGLLETPSRRNQNSCTCSATYYVLVAACADCSGYHDQGWRAWSSQCEVSYTDGFGPISFDHSQVLIPQWVNDQQRSILALDAYDPETFSTQYGPQPTTTHSTSTTPVQPTTSRSLTTTGSTTPAVATDTATLSPSIPVDRVTSTLNPSTTGTRAGIRPTDAGDLEGDFPSDASSSSSGTKSSRTKTETYEGSNPEDAPKKKNLAAIVGGAIAALILVLGAIAVLWYFWSRRKKEEKIAPSAAYMRDYGSDGLRGGFVSPQPFSSPAYRGSGTPIDDLQPPPPFPFDSKPRSQTDNADNQWPNDSKTDLLRDRDTKSPSGPSGHYYY